MASKPPKVAGEDFETLYRRLEETVARLEEGGLSLEQSLQSYESGMVLARRCQELLKDADLRVTKLQEDFDAGPPAVRENSVAYSPAAQPSTQPDELQLE